MRKFVCSLIFAFLLIFNIQMANAATFNAAYHQLDKKPMVVLVYANWADNYTSYVTLFRELKNKYGNLYNFVELDIASKDAKAFNAVYPIYKNLPYILLFKGSTKQSRCIERSCASSKSCTISTMKTFFQ